MRFLDSGTVKETGYSTVIIEHKGNKYVGQAKCHPNDNEEWKGRIWKAFEWWIWKEGENVQRANREINKWLQYDKWTV